MGWEGGTPIRSSTEARLVVRDRTTGRTAAEERVDVPRAATNMTGQETRRSRRWDAPSATACAV